MFHVDTEWRGCIIPFGGVEGYFHTFLNILLDRVNDQHTSAKLPPRKETPIAIKYETGWS